MGVHGYVGMHFGCIWDAFGMFRNVFGILGMLWDTFGNALRVYSGCI